MPFPNLTDWKKKYSRFRILELQSSGRKNELRLHYRTTNSVFGRQMAVESIPVVLADDQWHRLAVSVSGSQLKVFLDCQ